MWLLVLFSLVPAVGRRLCCLLAGQPAGCPPSWWPALVLAIRAVLAQAAVGGTQEKMLKQPRHAPPVGCPTFIYLFIYSFQESGACPPLVWNLSLAGFGCARVHVRLQGSVADCPASAVLTAWLLSVPNWALLAVCGGDYLAASLLHMLKDLCLGYLSSDGLCNYFYREGTLSIRVANCTVWVELKEVTPFLLLSLLVPSLK